MNTTPKLSFQRSFTSPNAIGGGTMLAALLLASALSPIAARAAGDTAEGKKIYAMRCLSCHGDEKTAGTIGPSLIGILGRKAATGSTGVHSRALMEADITWNEASLRKFLAAPSREVPGTIMPVSVTDPRQFDDLLAYLRSLR